MITRRQILFSGIAFAASGNAGAQQTKGLKKIGVLHTRPPTDERYQALVSGLRDLGYIEGKTILVVYRHGPDAELPQLAETLVRENVDLIFAPTPPVAQAARKATAIIPVVFSAVGDPVLTGLAASLSRPGGNLTGLTALGSNLSGKRLELLKEIVPRLSRVGVLWNPSVPDKVVEWKEIQAPAQALKLELVSIEARVPADLSDAFENARRARAEALLALPDPLLFNQRGRVVEFATQARLPLITAWLEAAEGGALVAYGPNIADLYRRSAVYIDKILKGAKPGELPIQEPTLFDFVINQKTAKQLGITVPQSILVRTTKIIE